MIYKFIGNKKSVIYCQIFHLLDKNDRINFSELNNEFMYCIGENDKLDIIKTDDYACRIKTKTNEFISIKVSNFHKNFEYCLSAMELE